MDINVLREAVMVIGFVVFLGIVCWAYAPKARERFERAAMSVFDDEHNDARTQAALAASLKVASPLPQPLSQRARGAHGTRRVFPRLRKDN